MKRPEGQWYLNADQGIHQKCVGLPLSPRDKGMGRIVGFQCCVWDTLGIPRTQLESSGQGYEKDCGMSVLCAGHTMNPSSSQD